MTEYTKMEELDRKIFITRIINCLCCSQASFDSFKEVLLREEIRCHNEGNLAEIKVHKE